MTLLKVIIVFFFSFSFLYMSALKSISHRYQPSSSSIGLREMGLHGRVTYPLGYGGFYSNSSPIQHYSDRCVTIYIGPLTVLERQQIANPKSRLTIVIILFQLFLLFVCVQFPESDKKKAAIASCIHYANISRTQVSIRLSLCHVRTFVSPDTLVQIN